MNAYIDKILRTLAHYDPIQVLESTPDNLAFYLTQFSEDDLNKAYAPDKWTVQEIYAHYADVEIGLSFRFRQALVETNYRPRAFDQDLWAKRYTRLEPSLALEAFRGLRAWNLALFASFDLEDWSREVDYPFEGIDTVDMMVRFLAGHDLNHLAQLELIRQGQKVSVL